MAGVLAGIARHGRAKGPIETIDHVEVSIEAGVAGDHRGARRPGASGKRQVTLIERADWDAAMAEVARNIAWSERRANLLVDGLDLPKQPGTRLRIGAALVLEITRECDPCERMEALAPGLRAALTPDWRGGACARVLADGVIAVGDPIIIDTSTGDEP